MYLHDVGMPKRRGDIGLAIESLSIFVVDRERRGEHLQGVMAGQPRMLGEVNHAHSTFAELTQNCVARVDLAISQRHTGILQAAGSL